jgi:hypothetical protein
MTLLAKIGIIMSLNKAPSRSGTVYLLIIPFMFIAVVIAGVIYQSTHKKAIEGRLAQLAEINAESRKVDAEECLAKTTPWRCIVDMGWKDRDDSIMPNDNIRKSRTHYVVSNTRVSMALEFCLQAEEENCAEQLVEAGYTTESVLDAVLPSNKNER